MQSLQCVLSTMGHLSRFRPDDANAHHGHCFAVLRQLRSIQWSVSDPVLQTLVVALVLSKLDYGSATLAILPAVQLDRLQSVLNATVARLIYRHWKFDYVSPLFKEAHWLRVPECITFWLTVLAYQCQHNMVLHYLTVQLQQASNIGYQQRLRSSSLAMFDVPRTEHVTICGRAFSSTAARVWNSLSTAVQSSESLDIFAMPPENCSRILRTNDFSFPCNFVPGSENSTDGTFAPMERKFHGTFAPWNFRSSGANVPRTFISWNCSYCGTFVPSERIFQELWLQLSKKLFKAVAAHLTVAYVH